MLKGIVIFGVGAAAGYAFRDAQDDPGVKEALNELGSAFTDLKNTVMDQATTDKDKVEDVVDAAEEAAAEVVEPPEDEPDKP